MLLDLSASSSGPSLPQRPHVDTEPCRLIFHLLSNIPVPSLPLTHIPIPALPSRGIHTPSTPYSGHMLTVIRCDNSNAVGYVAHGIRHRPWKWIQAKPLRQRFPGPQVSRAGSNMECKSLTSRTPCRKKCGWRRTRARSSEPWLKSQAHGALVLLLALPSSVLPGPSHSLSSTQHPSLVFYPWHL